MGAEEVSREPHKPDLGDEHCPPALLAHPLLGTSSWAGPQDGPSKVQLHQQPRRVSHRLPLIVKSKSSLDKISAVYRQEK